MVTPFLPFLLTQILNMNPVNALLWGGGLAALLREKSMRQARWLGLTYLLFLALMFALHAKDYYLAAIYPALFAAGGVAWEHRFTASKRVGEQRIFAFPAFASILLVTAILTLPMASPVLRPDAWLRYTRALHLTHPEQETLATGALPQFYADRFGWQQEVDLVTAAYSTLSAEDQARACVFASNYGEAGALELLAPLQGKPLPPVLSGQNNYWLWGQRGCQGEVVIALIHDRPEALARKYEDIQIVGRMNDPWSMPFEHHNIYLLKGRRASAPLNWADEKFFY